MKDCQVLCKKQQVLSSSLTVLGTKVDEVSNTAQQLMDNGHYASTDISANVTSLKQKYICILSSNYIDLDYGMHSML